MSLWEVAGLAILSDALFLAVVIGVHELVRWQTRDTEPRQPGKGNR